MGVSAKKFALRKKNGLKTALYGLLGEFFRGNACGWAVLGELFRGNARKDRVYWLTQGYRR